jgi:hypothetical protein
MRAFPDEFEGLLSARGRRLLAGRDPAAGILRERRFIALSNVVDPKRAEGARKLLERHLLSLLEPMDRPIPPEALAGMQTNYDERLPKAVRVRTAYFAGPRERARAEAERIGLVRMMRSESFRRFAAVLAGAPLRSRWGMQLLCYGPGDYTGPHNDHHPEDPEARDGYVDVHLTLSGDAVAHQYLVYEQDGHLSALTGVNTLGGLSAYRLPFWHYTTPLVAKPGRDGEARRWLLLGTFLYDRRRRRA